MKYRIVQCNNDSSTFFIQTSNIGLLWEDVVEYYDIKSMSYHCKLFSSIEKAKDYIKQDKDYREKEKKRKESKKPIKERIVYYE
jgi:hypothetical protein